ncbi:hypothetical protein LF1_04520 [Rubripirellula obstinata]|uniref:Uncharacterized protein n=1 Tax=Rubripirellula obstinata TaxID=406547 RepID=A0A5B1CCK1_9BACT|nr:hypothetical protein LF1_04520 [Rubripirellula obstinata]
MLKFDCNRFDAFGFIPRRSMECCPRIRWYVSAAVLLIINGTGYNECDAWRTNKRTSI